MNRRSYDATLRGQWCPVALLVLLMLTLCTKADETPDKADNEVRTGPKEQNSAVVNGKAEAEADELLIFEDMPVVISAGRRLQPVNWLSVPVSIVTAEDIHYSGLTTIPEMLRYVPGVDVLQHDRNRFAVGVRGLHDTTSDRTLVLIDGRPANDPLYGGVQWFYLPILMEDISRIEVVRGPGGAAWGANALSGVINIIMKEPEDCLGWFASTTWNHFGDSYTHLRWAAKAGKWSWRTSFGYEDIETSDDAVNDNHFIARDFRRDWRFDSKFVYRGSERTKSSFGLAYSNAETGDYEFTGYWPMRNGRFDTARSFARVDHEFAGGAEGYIQWYGNFARIQDPSLLKKYWSVENGLEGQVNFTLAEKHKVSMGANARWVHMESRSVSPQDVTLPVGPIEEFWAGLFAMDRWEVTNRLTLEGQVRGDWYSGTQADWSSRLSALYALDDNKRHVLRFSGAKAFRAPNIVWRKSTIFRLPIGGGLYAAQMLGPGSLNNEETWSIEAGYTGRLARGLTLRADAYFQRFDDLIGLRRIPEPLPVVGRRFYLVDNQNGANTLGGELELEWKGKAGKISAWYAYNEFDINITHLGIRSFAPSRHKVGMTGRLFLPHDWTLNANWRYNDETTSHGISGSNADVYQRLDLAVAKELIKGHGEMMIGINDVLNVSHEPVLGLGERMGHKTPGRTFFVRFQLKF
ncbi:MAG: TonB-dependent receptor [Planctomycetota bacterium]|nr:TonB-dependent receptor [Planctomycetota bacterium]